jgi:hypothetical protein
LGFV